MLILGGSYDEVYSKLADANAAKVALEKQVKDLKTELDNLKTMYNLALDAVIQYRKQRDDLENKLHKHGITDGY